MASSDQEFEKNTPDLESTSYQANGDSTLSSTPEDYVHNPEEFIDIHASDRNESQHSSTQNSSVLENESATKSGKGELDFVSPPMGYNTVTDLKVPVQVSEESESNNKCETNENKVCEVEDSDDEYQSAEEDEQEDDDSEDNFIPSQSESDGDEIVNDTQAADEDRNSNEATYEKELHENEHCTEGTCDEEEGEEKEQEIIDDLEIRKELEASLTEDEKKERKDKSLLLKDDGNSSFRSGDFDTAIEAYTQALDICPLSFAKERSIMFSNRAACKMKKELYEEAIKDSTSAVELHPKYLKALLRRAELYEKTEKLDEALKDYQGVIELDPSQHQARAACIKLGEQIKDRNEKMKEEMMGKLKDLGNLVLRPFGLSVNNFNLQQDPNTGSYSVQFQQNAPKNGS